MTQALVIEKDSKRFPKSGGWGYVVFNYEVASDQFTADPKSLSDCGHACHTAVKAKDYIFHPLPEALNRTCPDIKYPAQRMSLCDALFSTWIPVSCGKCSQLHSRPLPERIWAYKI
jgi:Cytochrome P460